MTFFSPTFSSAITQPKMRQEGFHLPSPSPSNGQPPSPSSSAYNDMYLPHASQASSHHGGASVGAVGSGGGGFPSLGLPDAYSRGAMDLSEELASLMASPPPNTSSERSTHAHTPPYDHHGQHHQQNGNGANHSDGANGFHPPHNIFDISAPPSHFTSAGAHAFSLPHSSSNRPDLSGISQPSSLHSPFDSHHPSHGHILGGSHQNMFSSGGGIIRDGFPAHFNSTIPPLSNHHDLDPPQSISSASVASDVLLSPSQIHNSNPFGHGPPYTPTSSSGNAPTRETPSPGDGSHGLTNGSGVSAPKKANTRRTTTSTARSDSRSRSRVRPGTSSSAAGVAPGTPASLTGTVAGGPTRTAKSASKQRRDSFTYHPGAMGTMLGHHNQHHGHPRPQAIVIPSHASSGGGPGSARNVPSSPLSMGMPVNGMPPMTASMGGMGAPMGMGVGQASGWFLPSSTTPHGSMPPGMGGEFSLPTPDSVGSGFGQFGTSVGSMGISPKDTTIGAKGDDPALDAVSKQAAIVNEKRRRRRESHNAVERRRRDNINEKITELATLIPEVMLDPSAPTSSSADEVLSPTCERKEGSAGPLSEGADEGTTPSGSNGSAVKANKGMILRKSVEYIRYLQQLVNVQAARNRDLETQLTKAGISPAPPESASPSLLNGAADATDNEQDHEMNGSAFGDDVLSFMNMSGGGFSHLEPMAEMEMEGMEDSLESLSAHEESIAILKRPIAANGCPPVRRRATNDASGSISGSGEVTSPSVGSDEGEIYDDEGALEERGRRDRDGRPRLSTEDIMVKEEGEGMDI